MSFKFFIETQDLVNGRREILPHKCFVHCLAFALETSTLCASLKPDVYDVFVSNENARRPKKFGFFISLCRAN